MLRGVVRYEKVSSVSLTLWISLAGFLTIPASCIARAASGSSAGHQPAAKLNVRVYGFQGLSAWTLQGAETEAARVLRPVNIELTWVDCDAHVPAASCVSPQGSDDLIVRFVAKALPVASDHALGITGSSGDAAVAFIFYDRVAAFRTHTRNLPAMLGRVVAHEITHLLLPQQGHSGMGLMRGEWAADDLQIASTKCLGLSATSVQFMQKEALRRMQNAHALGN